MKIALCGRFNTDKKHQGGSAEVFLSLAKELSKKHTVTLFGRGRPTEDIVEMCRKHDIIFHNISSDTLINIFLGPIRAWALLKRNFSGFDVIHTHTGSYAFASVFFRNKSKIVTHVHEPSIVRGVKGNSASVALYLFLQNLLTKFAANRADLVITPGEDMKNTIIQKWHIKTAVVVVPNGIDDKFFNKTIRSSLHVPLHILYVGRLTFQKRVERIINALGLLTIPARLTIVGDGDERKRLEALAKKLDHEISFEGQKNNDELLSYYRNADVLVVSSDAEAAIPLVAMEAMAEGLPILATNVTGVNLMAGTGLLVDEPYAEGFSKALTTLANNPKKFLDLHEASMKMANQFRWRTIVEKLELLYAKLIPARNVLVTTSWDDGHVLDMKLATLLRKYNLSGTFYISPEDREIIPERRLNKEQILELSKGFEIGAHTMTHPRLSKINDAEAREEIVSSKKNLEDIVGHDISSFCYPGGDYEDKHKRMVEEAGFTLGRTVNRFAIAIGNDPFALPTTIHAYRHWSDGLPIFSNSRNGKFLNYYFNWDDLAIDLFNHTKAQGGVFHIWGHSWEIEKNKDWGRLERVFKHIANRTDVGYVTNHALL